MTVEKPTREYPTDEQRQVAHLLGFHIDRPETWPMEIVHRLVKLKAERGDQAMNDEIERLQGGVL